MLRKRQVNSWDDWQVVREMVGEQKGREWTNSRDKGRELHKHGRGLVSVKGKWEGGLRALNLGTSEKPRETVMACEVLRPD